MEWHESAFVFSVDVGAMLEQKLNDSCPEKQTSRSLLLRIFSILEIWPRDNSEDI